MESSPACGRGQRPGQQCVDNNALAVLDASRMCASVERVVVVKAISPPTVSHLVVQAGRGAETKRWSAVGQSSPPRLWMTLRGVFARPLQASKALTVHHHDDTPSQ